MTDGKTIRESTGAGDEPGWVKLRSVTQENALDEFLNTAELAATDFTAERNNSVRIITDGNPEGAGSGSGLPYSTFSAHNPYLLTPEQRAEVEAIHAANREKLTVPRRPDWKKGKITREELDRLEKESFLDWRRQLAQLQDQQDLLLTPFERNIEVWRQLWRVIERSDLVVQIVDARNPLFFRSEDLEAYVKEYDEGRKHNLLLINKADLLTISQRQAWSDYFHKHGIRYAFFSAYAALQEQEKEKAKKEREEELLKIKEARRKRNEEENSDDDSEEETDGEDFEVETEDDEITKEAEKAKEAEIAQHSQKPVREIIRENPIHVLTVEQLEELFLSEVPSKVHDETEEEGEEDEAVITSKEEQIAAAQKKELERKKRTLNIGLVGYPNVGKSSTINALIGAKKVSVSSTPGKTKHFQTINLSPDVVLCDCPGLVFPNFSKTNAELVCNGVLPIDQLREFTGPTALVTQRIPKFFLEAVYGITIYIRPIADGGSGIPTASELLSAYARARGFMRAGLGSPDESRAARYILKDYVNAKLLYCHNPPGWVPDSSSESLVSALLDGKSPKTDIDLIGAQFNQQLYKIRSLPENRRQQILQAVAKHRYGENATPQLLLQNIQHEEEQKAIESGENRTVTLAEAEDMIDLASELDNLSFSQHIPLEQMAGHGKLKNMQLSAARTANSQAVASAGASFDRDFFQSSATWGHQNLPFHQKGRGKKGKGKFVAGEPLTAATKKDAKKKRRSGAAAGVGIYSDVY